MAIDAAKIIDRLNQEYSIPVRKASALVGNMIAIADEIAREERKRTARWLFLTFILCMLGAVIFDPVVEIALEALLTVAGEDSAY